MPSVSASVAGTVPPTVPPVCACAQVAVAVFDGSLTDVAVSVTVLPGSPPRRAEVDRDVYALAGLRRRRARCQLRRPALAGAEAERR